MTKTGTTNWHRAPKRILSRLGSRLDRRINLSVLLQLTAQACVLSSMSSSRGTCSNCRIA